MEFEKLTSRIGARIHGVDLSRPLDADTVAAIRVGLDDHGVLFFVGQPKLSGEQQLSFAGYFGEVEIPPFQTRESSTPDVMVLDQTEPKGQGADHWHADSTFLETPPMAVILQAHVMPAVGGDTCFSSMYAAYEALSPAVRSLLDGLTASHSPLPTLERTRGRALYKPNPELERRAPVSHPVVTVNPRTGRRKLFVNANFSIAIEGLTKAESDHWLGLLFDHIKSPEFQLRYRWNEGDVAFWDNHALQHYAVADYASRRLMQRVTLVGQRPIGIDGLPAARRSLPPDANATVAAGLKGQNHESRKGHQQDWRPGQRDRPGAAA
jgi:taurine dioxygenase